MHSPLVRDSSAVCSLKFPEDRLEVITEEEDEKDNVSITSKTSSSGTKPSTVDDETEKINSNSSTPTNGGPQRASFIYRKGKCGVI